jgi:hypothetical protein
MSESVLDYMAYVPNKLVGLEDKYKTKKNTLLDHQHYR